MPEWEEPPPNAILSGSGIKPGRYAQLADELRESPGQWAKVPPTDPPRSAASAQHLANSIRLGKTKGFAPNVFDVALQGGEMWVRFVGDADSSEDVRPMAPRVRAWAAAEGYDVPDRGRLPAALVRAYIAAMEREGVVIPLAAVRDRS